MQQSDKNNSLKLGRKIKKLRVSTSKSLDAFVMEKGGMTTATWSRLENGKNDFKLSTIIKAAALLGITVSELVSDIDFDYTLEE